MGCPGVPTLVRDSRSHKDLPVAIGHKQEEGRPTGDGLVPTYSSNLSAWRGAASRHLLPAKSGFSLDPVNPAIGSGNEQGEAVVPRNRRDRCARRAGAFRYAGPGVPALVGDSRGLDYPTVGIGYEQREAVSRADYRYVTAWRSAAPRHRFPAKSGFGLDSIDP